MAAFRINRTMSLQLNAFNLANKLYFDSVYYTSASENHVIPGPGRSARLSINVTF
jgi:catecholate siderophore receptor